MNALARLLSAIACAACLAGAGSAAAQDTAWVGDEVFIVLHAGPGTNYRWVAKLNPGTALEPKGTAEDGAWTEVTTDRGTRRAETTGRRVGRIGGGGWLADRWGDAP